ncbi:MAG: pilus assembly protein N-terminal domain-containing protein [Lachnospiraceae bacterium]|nr:pilus assembly protein N-terminal domain-containing protein [Lachnospiraceae bacterium]
MKHKISSRKLSVRFALMLCILGLLFGGHTTEAQAKTKTLKLSKTSVSFAAGKKKTVRAKGKYKKIKVKVANKQIAKATVKGKKIAITGVSEGQTKITVKAYKNGKVAAKNKITVVVKGTKTDDSENGKEPGGTEDGGDGKDDSDGGSGKGGTGVEPSEGTKAYDAGQYSIGKVHKGEATFYDRVSTGCANLDSYEKNYLTAALNTEDYMNGLAGAYLEVTDKDGDVCRVLITDRLPEGKKGDIDLSRKAFRTIEPEVTGRMAITWKIIPFPTQEPISYLWKETSSVYWAEIQVRGGRYPIKKLEYLDADGSYKELQRQEYNYFTAPSGMGKGPYTFRVTDFYGHTLIDKDVAIRNDGKSIKGKANFPY